MREDMDSLRALAEHNMSDKWRLVEREDDALVCVAHWQFGSRAIAIRPKLMTNEEWRPVGSYIAACDPQTILALLDDNDRLRKALEPFSDIDSPEDDEDFPDDTKVTAHFARTICYTLTLGHFRAARLAHEDADARP